MDNQNANYDAILILGGGLDIKGNPNEWVKCRLDKAIEVNKGSEYFITLSRGTTHKPPVLDSRGFCIDEATSSANYLISKRINKNRILIENISLDTIGNAFFGRILHTDPRKFEKLCIITSDFHMPRAKIIFNWIYNLAPVELRYNIDFINVPNIGIDEDSLNERIKNEKKSIHELKKIISKIKTIEDFHKWLYSEHQAYAVGGKPSPTSNKLKNTY